MQNRAVRRCCDLQEYDYMSAFYRDMVAITYFIQYSSLYSIYQQSVYINAFHLSHLLFLAEPSHIVLNISLRSINSV